MGKIIDALAIIDKVGGLVKETGGTTGCHHCNCRISNEDYDTFKSTNKSCPVCRHPYYDHDLFS